MRALAEPFDHNVFRRAQSVGVVKRHFKQQSELIRRGWMQRTVQFARLTAGQKSLAEHPDDWMERQTYRLVKRLVKSGHQSILTILVDEVGTRHGSRHDISNQPFKLALLIMFWWHELPSSAPLIDRRRRAEIGDAMEYARRHNVHSRHYCGFVKQAGKKRIGQKLKMMHWEPGFSPRPIE